MDKPIRKRVVLVWLLLLFVSLFVYEYRSKITNRLLWLRVVRAPIGYNGPLQDSIQNHIEQAECWKKTVGSKLPAQTLKELESTDFKSLKYVLSGNTYSIGWLEHSVPLLYPEAADMLEVIGNDFHEILSSKNQPKYKLRITSLTRSIDSQKNLSGSDNETPFWYGYSFSVSHHNFFKTNIFRDDIDGAELKEALERTLIKLQSAKKILVSAEPEGSYFTITLRCPIPS
jgi:hypothetical protein